MALKGNQEIYKTDIKKTSATVAERGQVAVHGTSGSGIALGDSAGACSVVTNPSGHKVAGIHYADVVNVDTARYDVNRHKDQTLLNNRCTLVTEGKLVTDMIIGTPAVGDTAYLSSSGHLEPTFHATGGLAARPKVGQFASVKDELGFAEVEINLPVV